MSSEMKGLPIVLVGAGGHGRVVLDALLLQGRQVVGIIDPRLEKGATVFGVPVLGGDEWLNTASPEAFALANGVGAIPYASKRRRELHEQWSAKGFVLTSVVHPSAVLGREVFQGRGIQVMAGAIVQAGCRLGEGCVINTRASLDHDCVIGEHAFVAPGAILCADIVVEERAYIGAGATILPGLRVGAGSIVAGGATVTKNVPPHATVIGSPAVARGKVT